jgi:hypothetical protein
MLALTLLVAAAQTSAPAAAPPVEDDIVVLARKLEKVGVTLERMSTGELRCRVSDSSGDPELDALSCQAALKCLETIPLSRANKKALAACGKEVRSRLLADLADQRRQTSQ